MVTDTPHSFCRVLAWIFGERMGEVVMAKYITKAQLRQLYQALLIDNDEYLRLLKEFAGIESRPTTEYNHYDENGDFIGSSVDTDLSDLLDEAGVEVRDDGPT